jgi:hypothetical protein
VFVLCLDGSAERFGGEYSGAAIRTIRSPAPSTIERGRVVQPFGFAPTDPSVRLSCIRLFPEVTRIMLDASSKDITD